MKKIKIDGSEIKVLDYEWRKETRKFYGQLELLQFTIDYIKIKICRENFKELLQKVLFSNKYVIEADDKKAEFFLMPFELYKIKNEIENEEIEIEFTGTGNEVL